MVPWAAPEVVADALRGDEPSVERLIAAIWPRCFRLAAAVLGDLQSAQDAAQEACVIVHQKVATLRNVEAFDSWVYRIVIRESARVRRRNHASVTEPFTRGFESDDTASLDVWRALGQLSPSLRDVTVLFYFDDLKSEEIAGILGVPHATVRTRLARARERLRDLLDDYAGAPLTGKPEVNRDAS